MLTSHTNKIGTNNPLPLVAQIGTRGAGNWRHVGSVTRTGAELVVSFVGEAHVCRPAWQACTSTRAPAVVTDCTIRFGIVVDHHVYVIAEGPVFGWVVKSSQQIAEAMSSPEERSAERKWDSFRRYFLGGGARGRGLGFQRNPRVR